jgi:signal transduction histidine kinase
MEYSLLKRRKLPLLFLLGVGIPGLALSILAFRGIRNELALLEQRRLEEHRSLARQIGDTLASELDQAEGGLSRIVAGSAEDSSSALLRSLDSFERRQPLVDAVFFLSPSGTLHLPAADLLFRAPGDLPLLEQPRWPGRAAEAIRTGQEEEFQHNRPSAAVTEYQRAFASVSEPSLRGDALLAVIRVQRKANLEERALANCETLLRDYNAVRSGGGMPFGAIAGLERSSMLLAAGDSLNALRSLVDLHEHLSRGAWKLERAQYDFLDSRTTEAVDELAGGLRGPVADSLARAFTTSKSRAHERRARAERLLLFEETAPREMRARLARGAESGRGFPRRLSVEVGGETFLLSLVDEPGPDSSAWGFLLNAAYLRDSLVRPVLESQVDTATTDWIVRARDGSGVLGGADPPSGPLALNAALAGNFPPWFVEFYRRPRNPYRSLLASSQSIYFYMFLAIATMLAFGLVLTVRAVTRELELARLKSDFVSTVSHEFKSPLTSILQLSEMLQTGRVPSEERRQWYYGVLVEQSARLSALVTNVLDLARIDEGRKEFRSEPLDLRELVEDVVTTIRHRIGHEGFEVDCHIQKPLPRIRGDAEALRQALSNLLDNAVQYSGDARWIAVRVTADDGAVTVGVEDRGVGIPPDEVDKVFDRFHRGGGDVTRSVRGSGLGLTLVKEIVDAHGGHVDVASAPEKGSTFRITLPAMTEAGRD